MIVFRKTMEAAVEAERLRAASERTTFYAQYGDALRRVTALQTEMSAWVMNKAENITPQQMAQMFYAQDDSWQAAFFNALPGQITAHHDALPKNGRYLTLPPGVPAGETQWCYMADHLDRDGFETIEAMYEHAKHARDKAKADA